MGAFFLCVRERERESADVLGRGLASLRAQGFAQPTRITTTGFDIVAFPKYRGGSVQLAKRDDDNFALLTGTSIFEHGVGEQAAKHFLEDFQFEAPAWDEIHGHYCAIVCRRGRLRLFVDRLGTYKVYADRARSVVSSSFLAVCDAIGRLEIDSQAVYEYAFLGGTYGGSTVMANVATLSGDGFYDLGNDFAFGEWRDSLPREIEGAPFERHVEAGLGNLRRIYRSIAAGFGGKIDSGLSGGYDSRLTLALLREQGVTPALHVYGKSDDPDVRVATEIARGEGLTLEHVDKSMRPATSAEDFPAVVADNCHALDGCPPDGIFDGGADVETRRERCAGGELMLNGGGGEIFRNFFYLPDRSLTVRAFLWSFYSRYDPSWCTDRFSEEAYLTRLGDKITADLGTTGGKLRRAEIELIYPLFRCRYWMGKNNSNNNRFGWALTPFIDYRTVGGAVRVPIDYKSYGRLQAELIRRIDPRLAGYPSVYGHPFAAPPPLGRRVKELLSIARPPLLRRYLYRIKYRRPQPRGRYLDDRFVHRVVDPGFPFLSRFFKLDRINDPAVYNRVCTLEYLFERHDPSDAPV